MKFAQAGFVVGEIAEAEGGDDEIERCIPEREMEGVGFEGDCIRCAGLEGAKFRAAEFSLRREPAWQARNRQR